MLHNTYHKKGTWNVICDRCGTKNKSDEVQKEWTGLQVCKSCWEPRHEQDFLRGRKETQAVPFTRPESADTGGTDIDGNIFPPARPDPTDVPEGTFSSDTI